MILMMVMTIMIMMMMMTIIMMMVMTIIMMMMMTTQHARTSGLEKVSHEKVCESVRFR